MELPSALPYCRVAREARLRSCPLPLGNVPLAYLLSNNPLGPGSLPFSYLPCSQGSNL